MEKLETQHPDPETLAAFLHGELADTQRAQIESHVESCAICCHLLRDVPADPLLRQLRNSQASSPGETIAVDQHADLETDSGEFHLRPEFEASTEPDIPLPLQNHPRYRVLNKLGAGGMGVVYLAEHRLMARLVALKVVNARYLNCQAALDRFHREVKAAARLNHRNIVTAFDAEQADNLHFLVMEYVEGTTLAELVKQRGPLPVTHACHFLRQAALGLQHAAESHMIHRDIKPQNLMRTPQGVVKILDFGLARFATHQDEAGESSLTREGGTVGTPDYIAPEQARNSRDADIRSDIYALGCTGYFLLAGRVPFPENSSLEKVLGHLQQTPQHLSELRSDLPPGLPKIIDRMMAKSPADRFQIPAEVADALKPFLLASGDASAAQAAEAATNAQASLADLFAFIEAEKSEPRIATITDSQPITESASTKLQKRRQNTRSRQLFAASAAAFLVACIILAAATWWAKSDQVTPDTQTATSPLNADLDGMEPLASDASDWHNLIEVVRFPGSVVAGNWQKVQGSLQVAAGESSRLEIPYSVPAEYDLEVTFTRQTGTQSVAIIFVIDGHQAVFDIDAWDRHLAGIQIRGGLDLNDQPPHQVVGNIRLLNGRKYTATLRVRQQWIEAWLDDELITRYQGDGSDLSIPEAFWRLNSTDSLGVGAYRSATTFHTIRLRQLDILE